MSGPEAPAGWDKKRVNDRLLYHARISHALTVERTALHSQLIPVTPYILVSAVECYRRHPEMMQAIAAARPPADIGTIGHELGNQIDTVHLWSIANIYLVGRKLLAAGGLIDWDQDLGRTATVLDFWERAAAAFRGDGTLQAADAGGLVVPYRAHTDGFVAGCNRVRTNDELALVTRLNARLTSFLFLLYFDTRAGYQDTGPYQLDDGTVMLLRTFNTLAPSHLPWSNEICSSIPYSTVTIALVLDGVTFRVTDFGTSVTSPDDYLAHVVAYGAFDTTRGTAAPIPAGEAEALGESAKEAQRALYRMIAAMDRRAKIDAGAYVYFSFLRPFADSAGVADKLDWTVPRDSLDLYPILETLDSVGAIVDPPDQYYPPIP